MTSANRKKDLFVKSDFRYDIDGDVYVCPAGERLKHHSTSVENGLTLRRYWHNGCQICAIKGRCTTGKERRVTRQEQPGELDIHPQVRERPRPIEDNQTYAAVNDGEE